MTDPLYDMRMLFGHVEIRAWLEYRDGKLIGMGSATEYDGDGTIRSHRLGETGVTVTLGDGA